jgi:50S ribosomal subunit-associated GTPase HflX
MASRTTAEIQTELDSVNATIARIVSGGVSEFQQGGGGGGGDQAKLLSLTELREHRQALERELARVARGTKSRFVRAWRY